MTRIRQHSLRLVALFLALAIFAGSLAMHAPLASHASAHPPHHAAMTDAAAPVPSQASHDCPSEASSASPAPLPHGDCTSAICCFAQLDSPVPAHDATLLPASYGRTVAARLPQADPERSDKPPKHT